jgi:cation transport ATPase
MGTGTDVAIESAKITVKEIYRKVVKAKALESCCNEKINQNYFLL